MNTKINSLVCAAVIAVVSLVLASCVAPPCGAPVRRVVYVDGPPPGCDYGAPVGDCSGGYIRGRQVRTYGNQYGLRLQNPWDAPRPTNMHGVGSGMSVSGNHYFIATPEEYARRLTNPSCGNGGGQLYINAPGTSPGWARRW